MFLLQLQFFCVVTGIGDVTLALAVEYTHRCRCVNMILGFQEFARSGTAPSLESSGGGSSWHVSGAQKEVRRDSPLLVQRPTSRADGNVSDINLGLRMNRMTGSRLFGDSMPLEGAPRNTYNHHGAESDSGAQHTLGDRVRNYIQQRPLTLNPSKAAEKSKGTQRIEMSHSADLRLVERIEGTVSGSREDEIQTVNHGVSMKTSRPWDSVSCYIPLNSAEYEPEPNQRERIHSAKGAKVSSDKRCDRSCPEKSPKAAKRGASAGSNPTAVRRLFHPLRHDSTAFGNERSMLSCDCMKSDSTTSRDQQTLASISNLQQERPPSRQKNAFPTHLASFDIRPKRTLEGFAQPIRAEELEVIRELENMYDRPPSRQRPPTEALFLNTPHKYDSRPSGESVEDIIGSSTLWYTPK
jgi:hypothetical protein